MSDETRRLSEAEKVHVQDCGCRLGSLDPRCGELDAAIVAVLEETRRNAYNLGYVRGLEDWEEDA